MDQEIETPAQVSLLKACSNEPLNKQEWECLLRFVALHDIRSPANYIEQMNRWKLEVPSIIEEAMQSAVIKMEADQNERQIPDELVFCRYIGGLRKVTEYSILREFFQTDSDCENFITSLSF